MNLDQTTELEEELSEHQAKDEDEEAMRALLARLNEKQATICSCGRYTCGAIGLYEEPLCAACGTEASHSCDGRGKQSTCDGCCTEPNCCADCGGRWHCQWHHACTYGEE